MTDSQWEAIRGYITQRLVTEESFEIRPASPIKQFGLTVPFYRAMLAHAERTKANFNFHGDWKTLGGDPTNPIRFSRRS